MKKALFILSAMAVFSLASCNKLETENGFVSEDNLEMVFGVQGDGIEMAVTKATAVESVSSIYWSATTGSMGSDTEKYAPMQLSLDGTQFKTGKYWPSTSTAYNYYVSNVQFSWNGTSHAATIAATNATDIVAGTTTASYKSSPKVTVEHIFARTGSITLNAQSGYEIIGTTTWKIKSNANAGTAGTYNIGSKTWSGTITALSQQTLTSGSDLYLVPGSYNIEITYTLKKGDFEKQYTKNADVTFVAGAKNNITATAKVDDSDVSEIVLSVEVKPWGDNNITIDQLN